MQNQYQALQETLETCKNSVKEAKNSLQQQRELIRLREQVGNYAHGWELNV